MTISRRWPPTALISARVTADTKERFAAVARQQEQSESVLLKRLVEAALVTTTVAKPEAIQTASSP